MSHYECGASLLPLCYPAVGDIKFPVTFRSRNVDHNGRILVCLSELQNVCPVLAVVGEVGRRGESAVRDITAWAASAAAQR